MHQLRRVAITALAAALAACGGGGGDGGYGTGPGSNPGTTNPGTTSPGVATNTITINEATFDPGIVTVPPGTTVTWQWNSCSDTGGYGGYSTCVSHNVTFDDGSGIASSTQSTGTFSRTFNTAGTYKYHCGIHGQSMSGQVNVK